MKRSRISFLVAFVFFITLNLCCSQININEVESNPEGSDSGNEWIELYSPTQVNLEDYTLVNSDNEIKTLNFSFSGYYVLRFNSQWLDNTNENLRLYSNNILVDSTTNLSDSKNNDFTWQDCDGGWLFRVNTQNQINDCSIEEVSSSTNQNTQENININNYAAYSNTNSQETQKTKDEEIIVTDYTIYQNNSSDLNINDEQQIIRLNSKKPTMTAENSIIYKSKNEYIREYAPYALCLVCISMIIFILIKKIK